MANDFTDSLNEFQDGIEESTEATRELSAKIGDLASKGLSHSDFAGTDKDGNDTGGSLHVTKAPTYQGEFRQQMTNYPIYPQANTPHPKQAETLALAQNIRATGDYAKSLASMQKAGKAAIGSLDLDTFSKSIRAEMSNLEGEIRKEAQALLTFVTEVQRSLGDTTTGLDKSLAEVKAMSKISPTTAKEVVKTTQAAINRVMASTRENVTITSPTGKPVQVSATQGVRNSDIPAINQLFTSAKRMDAELAKATSNVLAYTLGGGKQRASDNFHNSQARNIGGLAKHIGAGLNIFDAVLKDPALQSNANFGQVYAQFVDIMKSTGLSKADAASMIKSAFSLHDIAKYPCDKYNPDHGGAAFDIVPKSTLSKYVAAMSKIHPSLAEDLMMGISDHHYSRTGQGLMDVDSNGNLTKQGQRMAAYAREHGFKNAEAARAYLQTRPGYQIIRTLDGLSAGLDDKEYLSYMEKEDAHIDRMLGINSRAYTRRRNAGYDAMLKGTNVARGDVGLLQKEGYKSLVRAMAYPGQADAQDRKVAEALGLTSIAGGMNDIHPGALALIRNKGRIGDAFFEDPNLGPRALRSTNTLDWLETLGTKDAMSLDWRKPETLSKVLGPEVTKAMYLAGTTTGADGKTRSVFTTNLSQSLESYKDSLDPEVFKTLKTTVGRLDQGFRSMVAQVEGGSKDSVNFGTVFKTIEDAAKAVTVPTTRPAGPSGPINSVPGNYATSELHKTKGTEDLEYPLKLAKMASAHGDPYKIEEAKQLLEIQKLTLGQKQEQFELGNKMLLSEQDRAKLAKVEIQQGEKAQAIAEATALKTAERNKLAQENPELYSATIQAEAQQKINNTEKTQLTNQLLQERINLINQIKMSSMSEEQKIQRINELLSSGNKTLQERNKIQQEGEMIGRDYMGRIGSKELSYGMLGLGTPKNKGGGVGGGIANLLGTNTFQLKQNALMVGSLFGAGAASTWGLLRQGTQQLKEAETAAINLSRVFNGTTADLQALQKEALSMSVQYGQSIQDISEMQEEWAKTGKDSYTEISKLTEATVLALNTSNFESAEKATKSLNSAIVQMGIGADKVIALLDSWNAVADAFPADTQDLAEAYERSGSYARSVGLDSDELNALAITIMERTGRSGAEAGTAMRAIFSNMFKDKSVKTLEGMGIQVYQRDAEGNIDNTRYRDFVDILRDAGAKYTELSAAGKTVDMVALSNALGQSRQRNFAIAAMEGMATFDEKLAISRDAEGYSQEKLDKTMGSWDKKAAQLGAAFQSATVALMDTGMMDVIKGLTEGMTDLLNVVNSDTGIMEEHGTQMRTVIADLIVLAGILKLVNNSTKAKTGMKARELIADKTIGRFSSKPTAWAASKSDSWRSAWNGTTASKVEDITAGVSAAYTRRLSAGFTDPKAVTQQLALMKNQKDFYTSIAANSAALKGNEDAIKSYVTNMMAKQTVDTANLVIMDQAIAKTIQKGMSEEANAAITQISNMNMETQIALSQVMAQTKDAEAIATLNDTLVTAENVEVEKLASAATALYNLNEKDRAAVLALVNAQIANNSAVTADNTAKIVANTKAAQAAKLASKGWAAAIGIGIIAVTSLVSWLRSAKKQAEELADTKIKIAVETIETATKNNQTVNELQDLQTQLTNRISTVTSENKDPDQDETVKGLRRQIQEKSGEISYPEAVTGWELNSKGEVVPVYGDTEKLNKARGRELKDAASYDMGYRANEKWSTSSAKAIEPGAFDGLFTHAQIPATFIDYLIDEGKTDLAAEVLGHMSERFFTATDLQFGSLTPSGTKYPYWATDDKIQYASGAFGIDLNSEQYKGLTPEEAAIKKWQTSRYMTADDWYLNMTSDFELPREDWLVYFEKLNAEIQGSDKYSEKEKTQAQEDYKTARDTLFQTEKTEALKKVAPLSFYKGSLEARDGTLMNWAFQQESIRARMNDWLKGKGQDERWELKFTTGLDTLADIGIEDLKKLKDSGQLDLTIDTEDEETLTLLKDNGIPVEANGQVALDKIISLAESGIGIPVTLSIEGFNVDHVLSGKVDPDSIPALEAIADVTNIMNATDPNQLPAAIRDVLGDKTPRNGTRLVEQAAGLAERAEGATAYNDKANEAMDGLTSLAKRITKGTADSSQLEKYFTKKVGGEIVEDDILVSVFKEMGYLDTDKLADTNWVGLANAIKGNPDHSEQVLADIFSRADKKLREDIEKETDDVSQALDTFVSVVADKLATVDRRIAQLRGADADGNGTISADERKAFTEAYPDLDVNGLIGKATGAQKEAYQSELDTLKADRAIISETLGKFNAQSDAIDSGLLSLLTKDDFEVDYKSPQEEFSDYLDKVNKSLSRFENQCDKAMHALEKFDALNQFSSLDPNVVKQRAAYVQNVVSANNQFISEAANMDDLLEDWQPGDTFQVASPYSLEQGTSQAQALAKLALGEVGYETGGGRTNELSKYTQALGIQTAQAWCADFVSALAKQVGLSLNSSGVEGLKSQVNYKEKGSYAPRVGDLAFFQYDDDAALDHVEIVVAVDANGNVTTVGGNTTGGKVKKSTNKSGLVGYGSYSSGVLSEDMTVTIPGDEWDEYERFEARRNLASQIEQAELDNINLQMEQRQLEYQSRMEKIDRALYRTESARTTYASMFGDITDSVGYVSKMNAAIDEDIAERQKQILALQTELAENGNNYDWLPEIQQQIDDLQNSIYDLQWEKLNNDLALFARRLQDIDDAVARLNTKLQLDSSLMSRNITKDYKISGGLTKEQYDQYYKNKEDWTWASQQRLNYDAASEEYAWLTSIMTAANQANIALRSLASTNLGFDVGDGWEAEILGVAQTLKAENVLVDNTVAKAQVMMKGYNDILWQTKQSQVELTAEVADLEGRLAEAIAAGNTEAKIESLARTLQEKRDALQSAVLDESEVHSEILGYLTDLTKYGYQEALEEETKLIDANLEAERKRHEEWLKNRQEEQDLLKRRWEDEDQAKKIAEIDEDIAELEEKKANLDNDSSQYAAKLRQDYQKQIDELKKQKADAQLQYERTLQQREYDDEVEAENKAYDDFVEQSNEEKEALQEYYNNLIERAEAYVNGLYEAFGRSPQLTLGKLTELIPEISEAGRDAAEAYLTAFQEGLSLNTLTQRLNANDFGIDQSMLDTIPEAAQRELIKNSVDWLNLYMSGYSADNPILQALNKDSIGIRSKYGLDSDWLPQSLIDYRSTLFKDGKVSDMHDQAYLSNYGSYITKDGITQDQANEMVANSAKWHELQKEANLITQDGNLSIEQLDAANQSRLREIKAEQDALHNSSEQIRLQAKAFYESTGRVLENWETWMPTNGDPYAEYAKGENTTVVGEDAGVTTGSRAHGLTSDQVSKYKQNQANWMAWDAEKKTLASADNEYRWLQSIIDSAESTEEDKAWAKAEQAKYEDGWKRFNELLELQKQANQENISFRKIASANLGRTLDDTWVPTFGDGGIVEGDGLAYLHKKEMVLPEVYANAIEFIADTLNTPRMHQVDKAASSSETKVEVREAVHIEHAQFNDEVDLELIEKRAGAKLKADLRSKGIR